jgi:hypothetical protein
LQGFRGLVVGGLVGVGVAAFVMVTLHATTPVGVVGGLLVGLSVFAVVATKSDASDEAADAAWREASLDLPPASERLMLERTQASMAGPAQKRTPQRRPPASVSGGTGPEAAPTVSGGTALTPAPAAPPAIPAEVEPAVIAPPSAVVADSPGIAGSREAEPS